MINADALTTVSTLRPLMMITKPNSKEFFSVVLVQGESNLFSPRANPIKQF